MTMGSKRRLAGGLAALFVMVGVAWPSQAWAASDSVDSWHVDYTVDTAGVLHVRETIVWRFGTTSGRHGIDRVLVTREPWGSVDEDAVYDVSNIYVTSRDAPDEFTIMHSPADQRDQQLDIRIGLPNQRVPDDQPTATYILTYDVAGAMRSSSDYDELYWDAIGDNTPVVNDITVTVSVPGGVLDVACYAGAARTSYPCDQAIVNQDGTATYHVAKKAEYDIVTIGAMIGPGLVSDNQPHLQPAVVKQPPTWPTTNPGPSTSSDSGTGLIFGLFAALLIGGVVVGMAQQGSDGGAAPVPYRPPATDLRFLGVAPGTTEAGDRGVGPDDKPTIPVAFIPPKIPVAGAGLLDDGSVDVRDMTAALISLAVRGVIKLTQNKTANTVDEPVLGATMMDMSLSMAPHERNLLVNIFSTTSPGDQVQLSGPSGLVDAFKDLKRDLLAEASQAGWYAQMPEDGWGGQRSALGRAYEDQLQGFREYLTTAEADQIKYEEGEDIFSQYLPWAVIFGVAQRWAEICGQLVQDNKLPTIAPAWFAGDQAQFDAIRLLDSFQQIEHYTSAAYERSMPRSDSGASGWSNTSSWDSTVGSWSSSGTGFGAGSAFGGSGSSGGLSGGFSGGGGGGGGARSW